MLIIFLSGWLVTLKIYFFDYRTLSQTNLKLTLHPIGSGHDPSFNINNNNNNYDNNVGGGQVKKSKRAYWARPLPHLASFRCVAGSVPKIRVRTPGNESGIGNKRNPVFRSNSFRYEKYGGGDDQTSLDTISEKSVLNMKKVRKCKFFNFTCEPLDSGAYR